MGRLDVPSGQTYTVSEGGTQEFSGADVYGELRVNGTLNLIDQDGFDAPTDEGGIDLPLGQINFTRMNMGLSIFIVGMLGFFGTVASLAQNWVALGLLGLAVVSLILSGTVGIGLEVFWMLLILVALTLTVGSVVSWSN